MDIECIGFHESSLTEVRRIDDGTICLLFDDVRVNEQIRSASVFLKGVHQIIRDGLSVDDLTMEHSDGEVLTLDTALNSIHLIIEWNDFEKHQQITRSYKLGFEAICVEVT